MDTAIDELLHPVKPRLRGWLHFAACPLALIAGVVLVALSPDPLARLAATAFSATAFLQFGISATFHTRAWGPRAFAALQRLDHANIFLLIAGSMTPFGVLLLGGHGGEQFLWVAWIGAALGVAFKFAWPGAPRWLTAPAYIAFGWAAVFYMPEILVVAGPVVTALLVAGGLLYSVGGVIYTIKRPDPSPRWFGFHEVFHALTLAAFAAHYAAITLAMHA